MTEFARDFVSSIDGTSFEISTKELCGGARIYYIFNDVFGAALESINPTQNLTVQDIRTAIRNSTGPRPSLFVPEVAFDLLVKPQIKLLESPSLRCVELVYEELMKICHNCTSAELQRFPRLHAQLIEVVSELLRERLGPTSDYTSSLIAIQEAYINTNHPEFVAGQAAIARGESNVNPKPPSKAPSIDGPDGDDVSDSEDSDEPTELNGHNSFNKARNNKTRSVSTSHNRPPQPIAPQPRYPGEARADRHHRPSSSNSAPAHSIHTLSTSPHTAKETFLNYFFGNSGVPGGPTPGTLHHPTSGIRGTGETGARELLPDLGTRRQAGTSAGSRMQAGLEGNATYDMKSLSKHLEAVSNRCFPNCGTSYTN